MHICIISENQTMAAIAANYLNRGGHITVLGENEDGSERVLLSEAKTNLRGNDVVVVLCGNAKAFAIYANKADGINAVACKDNDDAVDAMSSANANVIVIDPRADRRTITDILDGVTSTKGSKTTKHHEEHREVEHERVRERERPMPQAEHGPSIFSDIKEAVGSTATGLRGVAASARGGTGKPHVSASKSMHETINHIKTKGLKKHIWDTFGIED